MNIEGFAFFFYSDNVSQNQLYDILEGFVLRNFQNDNRFCFLQITCLIYVIGSCDLVRCCIGPQGLIICKNLKNEKNQVRRFCTLALVVYLLTDLKKKQTHHCLL